MAGKLNFTIKCEGDCERISKVFIEWLASKSPELKNSHTIKAPNAMWATMFSEIYADEVFNYGLTEEAESNIIQVNFEVDRVGEKFMDLSSMSHEELLEFLDTFKDLLFDADGYIEIEEPEHDEDDTEE